MSTTRTDPRNPCPSWCQDRHDAAHWDRRRGLWETLHARRYGPVTVYLPQEIHDDGMNWVGHSDIMLKATERQQQLEGEVALTTGEALDLAGNLRDAWTFAQQLDQHVSAQAARGLVVTDEAQQGEPLPV